MSECVRYGRIGNSHRSGDHLPVVQQYKQFYHWGDVIKRSDFIDLYTRNQCCRYFILLCDCKRYLYSGCHQHGIGCSNRQCITSHTDDYCRGAHHFLYRGKCHFNFECRNNVFMVNGRHDFQHQPDDSGKLYGPGHQCERLPECCLHRHRSDC